MRVPLISSKKPSGDLSLGEILLPFIELLSLFLLKIVSLLSEGVSLILTRYIPRESSSLNLKKIDRSDLQLGP